MWDVAKCAAIAACTIAWQETEGNMKKMVGLLGNLKTILNHWEFCRSDIPTSIASMVFGRFYSVGSIHLQPR